MSQVNIVFTAIVKAGLEDEFASIAKDITDSTRAEESGCITFVFQQNKQNPRQFVAYEQYEDENAMNAHFARLATIYGTPRDGEVLPPKLHDFFESMQAEFYTVVGSE